MPSKELVKEGPIFLTTKAVKGEPLLKELIEKIDKLVHDHIIRWVRFITNAPLH